jgi:hypothetical protein
MAQPSRVLGYGLLFLAFIASVIALFFGYYGAKLVYLAAIFGSESSLGEGMSIVLGVFSYLSVITAAALFPIIAVVAAAIALVCWNGAKRHLKTTA